jgi:hypothetical protein
VAVLLVSLISGGAPTSLQTPAVPRAAAVGAAVVDATTLDRKMMFGYQGWFLCPGDGSPPPPCRSVRRAIDDGFPFGLRLTAVAVPDRCRLRG